MPVLFFKTLAKCLTILNNFENICVTFYSLRCEIIGSDKIVVPGKRLSRQQLEQEAAFKAASGAGGPLLPISLLDLFMTLNVS